MAIEMTRKIGIVDLSHFTPITEEEIAREPMLIREAFRKIQRSAQECMKHLKYFYIRKDEESCVIELIGCEEEHNEEEIVEVFPDEWRN